MTSIEFELQQCTRVTVKICEMFDEEEEGATKRDEKMKKRNSKLKKRSNLQVCTCILPKGSHSVAKNCVKCKM